MKPEELMILALRVLAVFIASQAIFYLTQGAIFWVSYPENTSDISLTALTSLWMLAPSIAAIIVWCCAPYIARLAVRGITNEAIISLNSQTMVSSALVTAGAIIFVDALPSVVNNAISIFTAPQLLVLPPLVSSILRCLLGAGLVIGARGISQLLLRLRQVGTYPEEPWH